MPEASDPLPLALLVTRNFPPLVGGMEKVNLHLLRELAREWRVALSGPSGCAAHVPEAIEVRETALRPLSRFLFVCTFRTLAMAHRLKPRLVVAGSGLAAPIAWLSARVSGAKLAVYLHGLDIIVRSWTYQRFWIPFIRSCDVVLVNSHNTARLAVERGVDPTRIRVLHPGVELPGEQAYQVPRKIPSNGMTLLSVGRLTRRKGLVEFIREALPRIVERHPEAVFLVIGEDAADALYQRSGSEKARILEAASGAGLSRHVRLAGRCDAASLQEAYESAAVHVFPVLDQPGDVEGFGMVALEAAAHGLRTVAFAVGGVPDAIREPDTGLLVPPGDYLAFADAVDGLLVSPQTEAGRKKSREFAGDKDWEHFGTRLRSHLSGTAVD